VSDQQASPPTANPDPLEDGPALEPLAENRPAASSFMYEMLLRSSILGAGIFVLLLVCAPIAYYLHAQQGVAVAALSAGVCAAGALISVFTSLQFRAPEQVLYQVLAGMLTRMAAPLALMAAIYVTGGWMREAGGIGYLLVFYLATLSIETGLVLRDVKITAPTAKTNSPAGLTT